MSHEHIDKFYRASVASRDTQLFKALLEGSRNPDDFIRKAVQAAGEQGYEFTEAEAAAWIKERQQAKPDRELLDDELETVAGGGFDPTNPNFVIAYGVEEVGSAVESGAKKWGMRPSCSCPALTRRLTPRQFSRVPRRWRAEGYRCRQPHASGRSNSTMTARLPAAGRRQPARLSSLSAVLIAFQEIATWLPDNMRKVPGG